MNEYMFGLGDGRVGEAEATRIDGIARTHGAYFVRYRAPGSGPRFWFATRNYGDPFNGATARAVLCAVGPIKRVSR
jgi:hypothetical protein